MSNHIRFKACLLCATVVAAASLLSQEQTEKKIAASALPPAVRKAAAEQSKGATVLGYSMETEKGTTFYEVEMKSVRTRIKEEVTSIFLSFPSINI